MKVFVFRMLMISFILVGCSSDENVLGNINGTDVTRDQFDAYLEFKRIKVRDDNHREKLLEQYFERVALSQVIERKFDDKAKQATQAELEDFKRQMNISRYFERYLKESVTDTKIQNYYASNKEQYSDTKVHVAHVLFRLKKGMSEAERKAKLTTATEAWSKIKAGDDFAKIADDYSEDRISAKKAGDLGWLKKGSIDPKFSQKIFEMKINEISEPFETSFGYHIVKIITEEKIVIKPFDAVKGDIRHLLRQEAKDAELQKLKSGVEISLENQS